MPDLSPSSARNSPKTKPLCHCLATDRYLYIFRHHDTNVFSIIILSVYLKSVSQSEWQEASHISTATTLDGMKCSTSASNTPFSTSLLAHNNTYAETRESYSKQFAEIIVDYAYFLFSIFCFITLLYKHITVSWPPSANNFYFPTLFCTYYCSQKQSANPHCHIGFKRVNSFCSKREEVSFNVFKLNCCIEWTKRRWRSCERSSFLFLDLWEFCEQKAWFFCFLFYLQNSVAQLAQ